MHTVHTIMTRIAKLRVHIAPVGYEIDRIVLPAKQERADKVWLLAHENKSDDKAGPFITKRDGCFTDAFPFCSKTGSIDDL